MIYKKKIKQDYRKNRISIDVGGAQTQKELLTSLENELTTKKTEYTEAGGSFD